MSQTIFIYCPNCDDMVKVIPTKDLKSIQCKWCGCVLRQNKGGEKLWKVNQ